MSSGTRLMTIILAALDDQLAGEPPDNRHAAIGREYVAILRREDAKGADDGAEAANAMRAVLATMIGSVAAAGEIELAERLYGQHRARMEATLAMGIADGLLLGPVAEPGSDAPDVPKRRKETLQ